MDELRAEIIERLNDRLGTDDFIAEDRLIFEQIKGDAVRTEEVRNLASATSVDKFASALPASIGKLMLDRAATNDAIVTRYLEDPEFREVVNEQLARAVYAELAAEDMSLSPAPGEGVPAPDEGSAR